MAGTRLSEADHLLVSQAVAAAEAGTDGEIVTIVAERSDQYRDVALHAGVVAMLATVALASAWPPFLHWLSRPFGGGWGGDAGLARELLALMLTQAAVFLGVRYLMEWRPLRLALTPPATKARRVRARAVELFKAGTERRTDARTGVLLYLSRDEHLAELVADEGIHAAVPAERWGDAMVALVDHVRAGRTAQGMAAAVTQVGAILVEHRPRGTADVNELPDRLIEL